MYNNIRLSPGQTALDGLITAKKRQKVVSRETADVVRYSCAVDVVGRGERLERRQTQKKVLNCSKL